MITLEVKANAIFKAFKEISCGKEIQKEYILNCHMKEGFVTLLRNMALRPLSEAFKLVIKADLEISHDKDIKEEISIIRRQAPHEAEARRGQWQKSEVHRSGHTCWTVA